MILPSRLVTLMRTGCTSQKVIQSVTARTEFQRQNRISCSFQKTCKLTTSLMNGRSWIQIVMKQRNLLKNTLCGKAILEEKNSTRERSSSNRSNQCSYLSSVAILPRHYLLLESSRTGTRECLLNQIRCNKKEKKLISFGFVINTEIKNFLFAVVVYAIFVGFSSEALFRRIDNDPVTVNIKNWVAWQHTRVFTLRPSIRLNGSRQLLTQC